jgi:hypothetical protein
VRERGERREERGEERREERGGQREREREREREKERNPFVRSLQFFFPATISACQNTVPFKAPLLIQEIGLCKSLD